VGVVERFLRIFPEVQHLPIVEMTAGRVMAMPESFLSLRHGLIAFLREDTPILCFASSDAGKRRYDRIWWTT
jgi:fructoselysine-6-P-deglycase FrlB-like protein